jgi:DNA integrity scanning protein DisA with diadenylate cyclase activity
MTPEEKVLDEIKSKLREFASMSETIRLQRAELTREQEAYKILIDDYKKHKEALLKRETAWNLAHQ